MYHYAALFLVVSCLAVFFEFGGLVTGSAEIVRVLALFFLLTFLVGVVATLVLNLDEGPSRQRSRQEHFRRIRGQGRPAD